LLTIDCAINVISISFGTLIVKLLVYGINYSPEMVGVGKYTGEFSSWMSSRGHRVRVITAPPYFPEWSIYPSYSNGFSQELLLDVNVQRCPLWVPCKPSGLTRLVHLASFAISSFFSLIAQRSWRPDVVITVAPAFLCTPGALLFSALCGKSCSSWLHIQDFELDAAFELGLLKGQWMRSLAEICERLILRSFQRVSSISSAMLQRTESKGVASSRCVFFPNWVDLESIRPQTEVSRLQNPYRLQLGIGADQLVLMYSGSMNKKQGLDLLVEVIDLLADLPQLVWLLAGEGPTKDDLVCATEGFSQVIHLPLQPAGRMNDWLNAADIHLLPQKAGAADLVLPSKLLGMLASGRPVVATSTSGSELTELATEAGACTSPGNAEAFANALRHLISDQQQRLMAGKRARKLAEERFGKVAVLERFEQQLLALVESRRY
jgi:colanic acid biosynthesis glycosyl transferase WcaI